MTIASATNKSGPYFYNGSATSFAYQFKISNAAHIRVVETVIATGVETDLVLNTDYTVTGVGADAGGNVVISPPRAAGKSVTLVRKNPFTQGVVLENQGAYFAKVVEGALDDAVARDQQLQEQISRAVVVPVSADATDLETLIGGVVQLLDNVDAVVTVAGIAGAVTTVATNVTAVSTVATNVAAVVVAATNIATIIAVPALATQVAADRVVVAADKATVAADKATVATNKGLVDTAKTAVDVAKAAADADVVLTHADVVLTHADAVATAADRVQTGIDKAAAAASAASVVAADIVHYTTETNSAARQNQARANISAALRGQLFGLTLSNNATDATNDIDIAVGEAASEVASPLLMVQASAVGKQLDAVYAAGGTPAASTGGRFDAAISDGTWYVFQISNGTTVGFGFSKSAVPTAAPNYPGGYTHYRYIGSIVRESGVIVGFTQFDDTFVRNNPNVSYNTTNPGVAAVTVTLNIPVGKVVTSIIGTGQVQADANAVSTYFSALASADNVPTANTFWSLLNPGNSRTAADFLVITNASAQIRARLSASNANTTLVIASKGWIDTRGKNA